MKLNIQEKWIIFGMLVVLALGMGLAFFILSLKIYGSILRVETPLIPLFSCYEIHGTKCTVTSNKENPCSYKVLVCKTPTGEVVYRSEKYHE